MGYEGIIMAEAFDWRGPATAEYRAKRAELLKKVAGSVRAEQRAKERREDFERELSDLDAGARAFGLDLVSVDGAGTVHVVQAKGTAPDTTAPEVGSGTTPPEGEGQSAKQIILMALEAVYPQGLKASQLRQVIEREIGRQVHYKTPGMTLYRLKDTGDVVRDGIHWRLSSAPASWGSEPPPGMDQGLDLGDELPDYDLMHAREGDMDHE